MSQPVKYSDIFDFSNSSDIDKAIKAVNELDRVYKNLIKDTSSGANKIKASQKELVNSLNEVSKATKGLDETSKADQKTIQEQNAQAKALSATYAAQAKQITTLEAQIKKLTKERSQVAKKTQDVNNINKEAIKLESQLGKLSGQSAKETAALKVQIQEKRKALAAEAKEALGRVSLYQKESAKLNDLRNRYKEVALAQGQNSKAAKNLKNQIVPLDKKLKSLDASVGQNQRSVGAYGDAISQTIPSVGALRTQVTSLFRLIATNPIGIIVVALVGLIAAFGKTQKGADAFNKIFEQISATIDVVIGRVSDLANNIIDLFTGEGSLDKVKSSFEGIGKEIEGAVEDAGKLADTQVRLRQINIQVTEETAKRRRQIQDLLIITRDLTKSEEEQRNALKKANELELANERDLVRLAKEKLLLAQQEFEFTPASLRTDEQRLKIAEAKAEVENAIANSTAKQREILNRQNELETRLAAKRAKLSKEQEKNTQFEVDAEAKGGVEKIKISDEVTESIITNSKRIGDETNRRLQSELDAERDAAEQKKLIREASFESASIIGNQLFENGRINRENEFIDLQRKKEFELALAEGNAQKQADIEKKFAEQEKKLRIKQAKDNKKQALFNIALNTAQGITAALTSIPPNVPLSIAIGAVGAVQAAAVASQPLPAFEKGGISPGGDIITSEKGREMAVTPQGKLILTGNKGAEVRSDIPKGSAILTNPITEKLLKGDFDHSKINGEASLKINQVLQEQRDRNTQRLVATMQRENDVLIASLAKEIRNTPKDIFNVSDGDLKKVSVKGNTRYNEWRSKNRM